MNQIMGCPPMGCKPNAVVAFRFVKEPIDTAPNFLPVCMINPARRYRDDEVRCSAHALSLFSDAAKARKRYAELKRTNKLVYKTIGTHLAQGAIDKTDGLVTQPSTSGHFDLFESVGCDLAGKFSIIEALHIASP